ncbi:hypothetical protein NCCP133_24670 [Cytobacillus sp. NCCP-133]|nr:hypothetical protein NCCP133_24670 [Cytobacillus sp. NCCP-133]
MKGSSFAWRGGQGALPFFIGIINVPAELARAFTSYGKPEAATLKVTKYQQFFVNTVI